MMMMMMMMITISYEEERILNTTDITIIASRFQRPAYTRATDRPRIIIIIIIVYYARRQHIKYRKQNTPIQ